MDSNEYTNPRKTLARREKEAGVDAGELGKPWKKTFSDPMYSKPPAMSQQEFGKSSGAGKSSDVTGSDPLYSKPPAMSQAEFSKYPGTEKKKTPPSEMLKKHFKE